LGSPSAEVEVNGMMFGPVVKFKEINSIFQFVHAPPALAYRRPIFAVPEAVAYIRRRTSEIEYKIMKLLHMSDL